jgi:hypothetical protein
VRGEHEHQQHHGGADRMTYRLGVSDLSTPSTVTAQNVDRRPSCWPSAVPAGPEDVGHGQAGEDHHDRAGLLGP